MKTIIRQSFEHILTAHNALVAGLLIALAAGAVIITQVNDNSLQQAPASQTARGAQAPNSESAKTSDKAGGDKRQNAAASNSTKAPGDAETTPANAACGSLTLAAARSLMGSSATMSDTGEGTESESADIQTSSCVYANGSRTETIGLIARIARTSLGASANAVAFGSERPAGVTEVPGYGQAAYWDSSRGELNILNNNNRYTITRLKGAPPGPGSLQEAEAVAKTIAAKL